MAASHISAHNPACDECTAVCRPLRGVDGERNMARIPIYNGCVSNLVGKRCVLGHLAGADLQMEIPMWGDPKKGTKVRPVNDAPVLCVRLVSVSPS